MGNPRQITQIQQFHIKSIGAKTVVAYENYAVETQFSTILFSTACIFFYKTGVGFLLGLWEGLVQEFPRDPQNRRRYL